ncbi:MAG: hypothetical protein ABIF82_01920 [Planctomycetota bacterium]
MIEKIRDLLPRKKVTPEALGIHVGRDTLTIVRVAKLPGKIEVRQLSSEPLPRLPTIWPRDLVAEALRAARKTIDLKAEEARITLASDLAPSHFLVMPPMKGEQLKDALKLQIQNKSDNAASDLSYQFHVLEKRRERCRVFVPSIPTEKLRQILGSFLDVNCQIDLMEVEGVSFANLLAHAQMSENAPIAVLLIGRSWGEIFIFRRGKIVLSRPVSKPDTDAGSTDGATSAGAAAVELDLNDDGGEMDATHLGHLVRETNKTLDYFEIELLSPAVEHLFVAGKGSDAPGLTGFLQEQLNLHVSALDTGDGIEDTTGEFEPVLHGLAVAAAMGGSAE